jgi:hypothetical protein
VSDRGHDVLFVIHTHYWINSVEEELVIRIRAGGLAFESDFVFTKTPRRALRPTQLPIQWVPGSNPDVKRMGRTVNGSLMLRLTIGEALPQFPVHTSIA